MKTRKISLNGSWELYYALNEAVAELKPLSTADMVRAAGFESVAAEVPGNFELDLHRADNSGSVFRHQHLGYENTNITISGI